MTVVNGLEQYTINGVSCYFLDDIGSFLGPSAYKVFNAWFVGKTGTISPEGCFCVYAWDWAKFITTHEKFLKVEDKS